MKKEKETKGARLGLLVKPSLKDDLAAIAFMNDTSVNALVNEVLETYCKKNKKKISQSKELEQTLKEKKESFLNEL